MSGRREFKGEVNSLFCTIKYSYSLVKKNNFDTELIRFDVGSTVKHKYATVYQRTHFNVS